MHPIPARTLSLLLFFSSLVAAATFSQCLEDFKNSNSSTIGGVDSRGNPTSPAEALGLTYEVCAARCELDAGGFGWTGFAESFSSWLLPWLALISQLPFGSGNYLDDFISVALSVGSPALAAYSLALTSLNARSVYRRARRIKHESKTAVARALIVLQQTPLELTKDERLLAFIPINDQWRLEIVDRLSRRNAWPIVTGPPILWVVFAFGLTLSDSFISLDNSTNGAYSGHAVGTLWLWLLCLVIGWLWVPTFTCGELSSAVGHANRGAAKKAAKRIKQKVVRAPGSIEAKITSRLPEGMSILKGLRKPVVNLPQVPEENENERVGEGSIQEVDIRPVGQEAEPRVSPLPSPAHHRSTTISSQSATESQQGHGRLSVNTNSIANRGATQSENHHGSDRLLIPKDELGSLNRDELRLSAMFNYSRTMRYLVLVDDVLRALEKIADEEDEERSMISEITAAQPAGNAVFPPGAPILMFNASLLALILQCGTTIGAALITIFNPTFGVGCHALGYIVYGAIALLIFFLTIISTILARISETCHERSTTVKKYTAFIAIALRRISLFLAFVNAAGLIVLSCFHFSRFFDNCYCNAAVIGRGKNSYVTASFEGLIPTMRTARIAATGLAAASAAIYMTVIWLTSALPAEIDYL